MTATLNAQRRAVLNNALALGACALLPPVLAAPARGQDAGRGVVASTLPVRGGPGPGTWLVLLGTRGGPGIELGRSQTASAVVVDGRVYLVDCGYGTVRQLVASNVGYLQVSTIFFTHLHDDHTGDLSALLSYQWTNGKTTATDAYGPYGTANLIDAAVSLMHANVEIRTVDEGRTVDPRRQFHGHDSPASATPVQMFKDDRVSVTAVENTHYPARSKARMPHRSLALRIDTGQRSIVFCGDTAYSANVVGLARGADLFVCEVLDPTVMQQMRERAAAAAAAGNPNNIFRHVAETHSSPADVARMATEAKVKTVVLNHQVAGPAGSLGYPVTGFIDAIRQGFGGEVIVGQDLMVL
ncbi:MAG TPA: MBL fold metallo-hydrolase [Steroidobacteraceae bacterium]|jgi:ribonuclease BN (tRNA processing enzyme)|nr:MBL fold metallo-hydrolase [Steroidobacteraceae bacterium]